MDIQLHYTCRGSGAPLLLLHGNGEDSTFFSRQLEHFSEDFFVCAIDTRGHGQSPRGTAPFTLSQFADDLAAFMDEHELERADILGFSDGGNIALLFALRYPHRVRRLILNSANLYPEGLEPWLLDSFVEERRQLRHSDAADKDYRTQLLDLMLNEPHIDPADLAAITAPTLVIAGDRDIVQFEHTMLIAESVPNCRLSILPGGHDVAAMHPDAFDHAVYAFLEETEEETP